MNVHLTGLNQRGKTRVQEQTARFPIRIRYSLLRRSEVTTLSRQIKCMKTKFHFKFVVMGLKCHSKYGIPFRVAVNL